MILGALRTIVITGPWRSRGRRFRGLRILLQIDGSHHWWLDEQGPQFTLLLAVDGTTSAVVNAVFRPEEDTRGYFVLMQGLIQRGGVPLARYGDRHGVFKFSGKPKHIQPPVEATNFSRTMVELDIQQIFARSPQAKGRVERMARTFAVKLHPLHDSHAPQRQSGVSPVNNALTVAEPPFMVWRHTLIDTAVAANEGATQWPSRSIA